MQRRERFFITTAISYPNGDPHIGHAYELIAADVIARFNRLDNKDVFFLTGTDEHGSKMEQAAHREGLTPREFADRMAPKFSKMATMLNSSHDVFIRTTEPRHYKAVEELWRRMDENGDIYLGNYAGWYSVRDEAYYSEDEIKKGTDGEKLSPQGTPVDWVEEPSYFFRLSNYTDRLLHHYNANPDFIMPNGRRNEVISFVNSGLRDLSISRTTFTWGVPVPDDPRHIMYVWVDALTNYLTGVGYPDNKAYQHFWPANLHVIGKDILRFHAVYWPAFLMSADISLPRRVFGHGFLNVRGEKMSKSVGNVIDPSALARTYGIDQMRYFFMREVPFGQDGSYSHETMVARINADLANSLGNLVQRTLSMISKNCLGEIPMPSKFSSVDQVLLDGAATVFETMREQISKQNIHRALEALWEVVAEANRYVDGQAPWVLKKNNPDRMKTVLYVLAETIRRIAVLSQPVIPDAAAQILDQLGVAPDQRNFSNLIDRTALVVGQKLPLPKPVFPRFVEEEI